ncbi:hypothetical protein SAMN04488005_1426 [Yoonia tamlensis]|uniref:DUF7674 domain-containing protein n=1 Tax=Yoonia tamlensis TaxID=390270 RepID=A0A1I6GCH1_9RHOB|nr:hypothetical protein [Yoonia tamlensis]SFR39914.1 hypothetical protein SAMN04488005_1426 [Yoonia tamlensis]
MTVLKLYASFRASFAELADATDELHGEAIRAEADPLVYLWFEDLASVLNARMGISDFEAQISRVLTFIDGHWGAGSAEVRACIDTSFVENLFWQVPPHRAEPTWRIMPPRLQNLYIDFHGKPPNLP